MKIYRVELGDNFDNFHVSARNFEDAVRQAKKIAAQFEDFDLTEVKEICTIR